MLYTLLQNWRLSQTQPPSKEMNFDIVNVDDTNPERAARLTGHLSPEEMEQCSHQPNTPEAQ